MTTTATTTGSPPPNVTGPARDRAAVPSAAAARFGRNYIELSDIRWETYEALVQDVAEQHVGITYDDGRMVIRPPLPVHDLRKKLIGRMIEMASFVMEIPIASYGSTTWRRQDVKKGLEADECYYVQNEAIARWREEFDLTRDPPPDLAVEVENTHHPLDRPSIYAALGINEIWQHDGKQLQFLKRAGEDRYRPIQSSEAFPFLTPEVIERHLAMAPVVGEFAAMRSFYDWLLSLPRPQSGG